MKKIGVIVLILAGAGFYTWKVMYPNKFLYAGTVEATEVDLSARVTAVIKEVLVREGDSIKAGETLITLDGPDLILNAENAERDFRRAVSLHKSGSLSDESFDKAKFRRDDSALRVQWLTISSPLDGTVLDRYHEPAEMVAPGTKLLTVAQLQNLWAYIYVAQPLLAHLTLGGKISLVVPEIKGKTFEGVISHISEKAEFTPKNVQTREERTRLVYAIKLTITNNTGELKPGMTVEAEVPTN